MLALQLAKDGEPLCPSNLRSMPELGQQARPSCADPEVCCIVGHRGGQGGRRP